MVRLKTTCFVLIVACLIWAARSTIVDGQGRGNRVAVYEGARLITGDGSAPIENSAFLVENDTFTRVGRRGEIQVPAGAARVDLTGKTVMPTKVDLHGHIGYQHDWDGTMAKEYFTRENLIDHLAAPRVLRHQRHDRHRRPGRSIGSARWADGMGRRAVEGAQRDHAGRGAVQDRRPRHRLAGRRRQRPSRREPTCPTR